MRSFIVGMALLATAASAQERLSIGDQAVRCWNVPAGMSSLPPAIQFDVDLSISGGVKDITFVGTEPQDESMRKFVISASRAIEQCAPYSNTSDGSQRITMDAAKLFEEPIDPFKDAD